MIARLLMACALLGTAGCSSLSRLRTDISAKAPATGSEETALINNLRSGFQACRATGCAGIEMDTKSPPIAEFVGAGLALSDLYCDRFFRASNRSSRDRRFSRATTNDVGGAINVILGLAKAGSGVSNGVAAGFAFGDSLFRNYDDSYMVDADLSKMQRLVHAAQDNMKLRLEESPPRNIFAAESAILRYANICSFLGMRSLLDDSVAARTAVIETESKKLDTQGGKPSTSPGPVTAAPMVGASAGASPGAASATPAAPPPPPAGAPIR